MVKNVHYGHASESQNAVGRIPGGSSSGSAACGSPAVSLIFAIGNRLWRFGAFTGPATLGYLVFDRPHGRIPLDGIVPTRIKL